MKRFFVIVFLMIILLLGVVSQVIAYEEITPARILTTTPTVPWIEDVFIPGGQVPGWVTICKDTNVYGNPYGLNEPFYIVHVGDVVRVHDTSQDNTWIMIRSAHWIPMSAVCDW